ncbi:hypothetical protein ACFE04_008604 [Oxalis oulophora]
MSISRTGNGSTSQACAACKYQRRKCAPDCILAPYFPHDRQRQFLNAHKLFGVSNITKIIKPLDPPEKDMAMNTIIYQSDVRANDPVGGCFRIVRELQRQIEYTKAELELVLHQLAICRVQAQMQMQDINNNNNNSTTLSCDLVNADPYNNQMQSNYFPENEYMIQNTNNNNQHQQQQQQQQQISQEDINSWVVQDSMLQVRPQHQQQNFELCTGEVINHHEDHVEKSHMEKHDQIKYEPDEFVDRRFVPSTQLVISS